MKREVSVERYHPFVLEREDGDFPILTLHADKAAGVSEGAGIIMYDTEACALRDALIELYPLEQPKMMVFTAESDHVVGAEASWAVYKQVKSVYAYVPSKTEAEHIAEALNKAEA
jgi:hypothetical protein